jgi:hypothetical protein
MGLDLIGCDPLAYLGVIAGTPLRAREPTRYIIPEKKSIVPLPIPPLRVGKQHASH